MLDKVRALLLLVGFGCRIDAHLTSCGWNLFALWRTWRGRVSKDFEFIKIHLVVDPVSEFTKLL